MKNTSQITKWSRKVNGKIYNRAYIYLPAQVLKSEGCPIKYGDKIVITFENNHMIIKKHTTESDIIEIPQTNIDTEVAQMKNQNPYASIIICPQCKGKNLLTSRNMVVRKCTSCGFVISKQDFRYDRPENTEKTADKTVELAQKPVQPKASFKDFRNSEIVKCPKCSADNLVIPGGKGRKCGNCGFRIIHDKKIQENQQTAKESQKKHTKDKEDKELST